MPQIDQIYQKLEKIAGDLAQSQEEVVEVLDNLDLLLADEAVPEEDGVPEVDIEF